jgi:hypothetical protein
MPKVAMVLMGIGMMEEIKAVVKAIIKAKGKR